MQKPDDAPTGTVTGSVTAWARRERRRSAYANLLLVLYAENRPEYTSRNDFRAM